MINALYQLLKIVNDINAVKKGNVSKRIGRRVVGRATGKGMRKLFR